MSRVNEEAAESAYAAKQLWLEVEVDVGPVFLDCPENLKQVGLRQRFQVPSRDGTGRKLPLRPLQ